jgi:hypothetical protein
MVLDYTFKRTEEEVCNINSPVRILAERYPDRIPPQHFIFEHEHAAVKRSFNYLVIQDNLHVREQVLIAKANSLDPVTPEVSHVINKIFELFVLHHRFFQFQPLSEIVMHFIHHHFKKK